MIRLKKIICIVLLFTVVSGQLLVAAELVAPQPAKANPLAALFSVPEWNWYEFLKDISIGILRGAAAKASQKFLNDFIAKVTEKYKIRNYLYYDKVLSDYYLNRYLADKIKDPDLKQIYTLMERAYVQGNSSGYNGAPQAGGIGLIPQLKKKIGKYYTNKGGLDPARLNNPASFKNDGEYFDYFTAYYSNPIGWTQQNFQSNFSGNQSEATTAAQLEIAVGNGLKAGRIIGGTCSKQIPNPNPDTCKKAGGTWNQSALDQARSLIDNPTTFVSSQLDKAINSMMEQGFDPNNFWVKIGGLLGNFLVDRLSLKSTSGTLQEVPNEYNPLSNGTDYNKPEPNGIDIDGDGTPDGYDLDGDGIIDVCAFGGTAPDCTGSKDTITPPETAPDCSTAPSTQACSTGDKSDLVRRVKDYVVAQGISISGPCGAFEITKRVAWALASDGVGLNSKTAGNNCQGYSIDVIVYSDRSYVDILSDAGANNGPAWQPAPPGTNIKWAAPSDPGDPPGSY